MHRIFDKTDQGREEITTRKHRLAPRLRTLLLLIDGKKNAGHLLKKIAGIDEHSLFELLEGGFIQEIPSVAAEPATTSDAVNETGVTASNLTKSTVTTEMMNVPQAGSAIDASIVKPTIAPAPAIVLAIGETKFQAIQKFYTDNIRPSLGLRGYHFQTKVDEAQSVGDLEALHELYIAAVFQARGDVIAHELDQHLTQLFNLDDA